MQIIFHYIHHNGKSCGIGKPNIYINGFYGDTKTNLLYLNRKTLWCLNGYESLKQSKFVNNNNNLLCENIIFTKVFLNFELILNIIYIFLTLELILTTAYYMLLVYSHTYAKRHHDLNSVLFDNPTH